MSGFKAARAGLAFSSPRLEPGAVIGSQDHACVEAQRRIGKRLCNYAVSMKVCRGRLGKNSDTQVLRDQFHCLLWRNDIVSVPANQQVSIQ
jgi:hypothetical protein